MALLTWLESITSALTWIVRMYSDKFQKKHLTLLNIAFYQINYIIMELEELVSSGLIGTK